MPYSANVLYNVPVKFDGRNILSASSPQGQLVHASALNVAGTGQFDITQDQVLIQHPQEGKPVSAQDIEALATPDKWAALAPGKSTLSQDDLQKAGVTFCFDRNRDGKIEVNRSGLAAGLNKLKNAINEGQVTYNGQEKISAAGKEAVAGEVFKDYQATMDLKSNVYTESYPLNDKVYEQYAHHMDNVHLTGGLLCAGGLGTFAVAYASHASGLLAIGGLAGLMVGFAGGMCLMMAKLNPDIPVRY